MMDMKPLRYRNGNRHLHRESDSLPRQSPPQNLCLFYAYMQAGIIAQGLLHYLSVGFPTPVWQSFDSWLRIISRCSTISELVVGHMMRETISDFIVNCVKSNSLAKFIVERQDTGNLRVFRLAS
jgi:hypothetical protein